MGKFQEEVLEYISPIGGISSRAMFGGFGLYKDGLIFGMIVGDKFYLKVDESNKKDYEEKGSTPFTYMHGKGKPVSMSYWEVPNDIFDNFNELKDWIEVSYEISKSKKKKSTKGRVNK